MTALLRFYPGLTRAEYWTMPGDERQALAAYMTRTLEAQRQG